MKAYKKLYCSYEWAKIPDDLPKSNLALITAKTISPTIHPEDKDYKYRVFDKEDLKEAARSLARRPIGINHIPDQILPKPYQVIDAQWNEEKQAVEALVYLPDEYIKKIKEGKIKHVSVEYYWRDELREGDKVLLKGLVFDRVDLLDGMNPGDKHTEIKLLEGNKRLMEGEIQLVKDEAEEFVEAYNYVQTLKEAIRKLKEAKVNMKLGEPLGPYRDFEHCVRSVAQKGVKDPEAYCGYLYWKIEKGRKDVGKEGEEECPKEAIPEQGPEPERKVLEEPKEEKTKIIGPDGEKIKIKDTDVKPLEEEPKEQGNRTIDESPPKEEAKEQMYCVKCKEPVTAEVRDVDGKVVGTCPKCGTELHKFVKEEAKVDVPETGENIHVRVEDPDKFDSESFRYIDITEGVKAVVGCPKGQFEGGRCKVGTQVQKYVFDKDKFTPEQAKKWVEEHKREGEVKLTESEAKEIPKDKVIATAQNPAEVTHSELRDKQVPEVPSNPLNTGPMTPPVTPEKVEQDKKVMLGKGISPEPEVKEEPPTPAVKVETEAEKRVKELEEVIVRLQNTLKETEKKITEKVEQAKKEAIEQERKRLEELKKKELKVLKPIWIKEGE